MRGQVRRFAWYRFHTTFRQRRGGLLAIVLLTGLLGGLSMAAIATARSTESSLTDFAISTNTPSLFVLDGFFNPSIGLNSGYNGALLCARSPTSPTSRRSSLK